MKKFVYQITKKGRKWFEGINEKGYKAQILINETSNTWQEGQKVEFWGTEEIERSKFGTTVKIYPVSEEEAEKIREEEKIKEATAEYKRWKEYVEKAKKEGYVYEKGVEKLRELSKLLGNENETENYIKEVAQEVFKAKTIQKYNALLKYLFSPLSYSSFQKNYRELVELVEHVPFLKEKFEEDRNKIIEQEKKICKKEALEKIEGYRKSFERSEQMEEQIRKLAEGDPEILQKLEEVIKEKEEREEKILRDYEEAIKSLETEIGRQLAVYLARTGKLVNEPYIKVDAKEELPHYFELIDILKEKLGMIIIKVRTKEGENKENNILGEIIKLMDILSGENKEYNTFIPESKVELYNRIKEIALKAPAMCYSILTTMEGEPVDIEASLPTSWNHLKQEYVAKVLPNMEREFISERKNFSRSGCNADLTWELPEEEGTVIVAKHGSHKHIRHTFYRLTKEGWQRLCSIEGASWKAVWWEIVEPEIKKQIEEMLQ